MANPVLESLISFQADAAGADSNRPTSGDNAGVGQAQEAMGNLRLLKSEMRSESIIKSWERWKGLKNLAASANIAFTYVSATSFTVNDNFTSTSRMVAVVGRRVRAFITGSVIYGTITAAVYSAPNTTFTIVWDSGTFDNTVTEIQFGNEPRALPVHRSAHISGGGDAFLSTDVLEAAAKGVQTSSGPTILAVGAITDGQWLKRSGTSVIGHTVDITKNAFGNRLLRSSDPVLGDLADGDLALVHD